jgi:HEAT repeat protein
VDSGIGLAWLGNDVVSVLIEAANSDVSNLKLVATRELGQICGPQAVEALLGVLEALRKKVTKERPVDWDPKHNIIVFRNAILSYSMCAGASAFETVKNYFSQLYPCWDSQSNEAIVLSLGWTKDTRALPLLLPLLKAGQNYERQYAANALLILQESSSAEALVGALADEDRIVRQYAASALGILKYERALPSLLKISIDDKDQDVREAALKSIQTIGNK